MPSSLQPSASVESCLDIYRRALEAFTRLEATYYGEDIIIVSHQDTLSVFAAALNGADLLPSPPRLPVRARAGSMRRPDRAPSRRFDLPDRSSRRLRRRRQRDELFVFGAVGVLIKFTVSNPRADFSQTPASALATLERVKETRFHRRSSALSIPRSRSFSKYRRFERRAASRRPSPRIPHGPSLARCLETRAPARTRRASRHTRSRPPARAPGRRASLAVPPLGASGAKARDDATTRRRDARISLAIADSVSKRIERARTAKTRRANGRARADARG